MVAGAMKSLEFLRFALETERRHYRRHRRSALSGPRVTTAMTMCVRRSFYVVSVMLDCGRSTNLHLITMWCWLVRASGERIETFCGPAISRTLRSRCRALHDDGKTVTHPFFLPNEAHHGDPRS